MSALTFACQGGTLVHFTPGGPSYPTRQQAVEIHAIATDEACNLAHDGDASAATRALYLAAEITEALDGYDRWRRCTDTGLAERRVA